MGVLSTIFAWEIFQALSTILIFLVLDKTLKKWSKDDEGKKNLIKKGFTILIVFIGIIVIFSGFYTVHSNEKVILTKFLGEKIIDGDVGIHYSFLCSSEPFDMRKISIDYPTFGQGSETSSLFGEETLITSDGRVVQHSATLFYKIKNLEKFALLSKDTETKLYYNLGSSITNEITTNTYQTVMQNRRQIENEIMDSLSEFEDVYGVEILDFKFLRIMDSQVTVSAKANAEASKLEADAIKRNNDLLKESLDEYSPEQLDYLKTKMLSDSGNVKWVIPEGGQVIVTSD